MSLCRGACRGDRRGLHGDGRCVLRVCVWRDVCCSGVVGLLYGGVDVEEGCAMKPGEVKKSFDFPEFLVKLLEGAAADNARTVGREVHAQSRDPGLLSCVIRVCSSA